VQLRDVTMTARDGRVSHLEHVYIRGSHMQVFVIPDMLRNAPMFRNNKALRASGGAARAGTRSGAGRGAGCGRFNVDGIVRGTYSLGVSGR
jgi:small nuclear ribonucleoprotein D3